MLATPTKYIEDFSQYYARASILNRRNAQQLPAETLSGDDLQDIIPIYDTIWRSWAGFSKVLEDSWKGPEGIHAGKRKVAMAHENILSLETWLYVFLVHRITGSGASFERDHGYRNTCIIEMLDKGLRDTKDMADYILSLDKPIFTSIGNQIPPFNKPVSPYTTGGKMYLHRDAPKFCLDLAEYLGQGNNGWKRGIKPMTDWILHWHKAHGMKQYKFVLTAFAMDIAEYFPQYVDQLSHVYMGKNAESSLNYIFDKTGKGSKDDFHDACMDHLMKMVESDPAGANNPYSIEDVLCDFIRYVKNYIPKQYLKEGKNPKRLPILLDEVLTGAA